MRVRLADDGPSILSLPEEHLSGVGDCVSTTIGTDAVDRFKTQRGKGQRFGLVCLDVKMPDLDAKKVLAQTREAEKAKGVPPQQRSKIVMVTSVDNPMEKQKAFAKACDGYITKPINKSDPLNTLRSLGISGKATLAKAA